MAKVRGAIVVDTERCKGCNLCVVACPTNVIELHETVNGKGYNPAYPARHDACTGCMNCATVCPDMCITVYRLKPQN
ncbi:MAG: 4Fe-4S dicluster domain-containing protein [Chlorobi bacterium]|nr:4Fe-4S dicluster domain-containing protein [Chlorobiota bacterium]